jgi:hypothetical protein
MEDKIKLLKLKASNQMTEERILVKNELKTFEQIRDFFHKT